MLSVLSLVYHVSIIEPFILTIEVYLTIFGILSVFHFISESCISPSRHGLLRLLRGQPRWTRKQVLLGVLEIDIILRLHHQVGIASIHRVVCENLRRFQLVFHLN